MNANLRTLSGNEAKVVLSLVERGQDQVTLGDVYALIESEASARKVVHTLVRKGWLTRLTPGRYLLLPPEHGPENLGENNVLALASAIAPDSYVAWWRAAAFHGFTPQVPMTIQMASLKARRPALVEGAEVRFHPVPARKYFGYKPYNVYGREAVISTPAKTLVDCVDRPSLAGGPVELARIVLGALSDTEPAEVVRDALRMGSTSLVQRLGFLSDLVGQPFPAPLRSEMKRSIGRNTRSTFGRPDRRRSDIGFVADWGLMVNLSESELLSDLPLRRAPHA